MNSFFGIKRNFAIFFITLVNIAICSKLTQRKKSK
jgi:hypothetical protein